MPLDIPNFGSAPPHCSKLSAPPGLPVQPLQPPAVPKCSPDPLLAMRQPLLSSDLPHLASDTLQLPLASV